MMNPLIPFQFEAHAVRTVVDGNGEVWFVGKDVARALGFADTVNAMKQHCRGVAKHHPILDSLGRQQEARIISEPDLFRLVMHSKLPSAERFERWIFEEVLPSIRKTGSYTTPSAPSTLSAQHQDTVAAILLIKDSMANIPGIKAGILQAATLQCIQKSTGIAANTMRYALPASNEALCTLNATQLGKQLKRSAIATNQLLASSGFQYRNERGQWELTKAGEMWAEALPYARNGHSGYQILWNPAVVHELRRAA